MPTVIEPVDKSGSVRRRATTVEIQPAGLAERRYARDAEVSTLDIWIDAGDASQEDIAEVFQALSDLNRVLDGDGLRFFADRRDSRHFEGRA